MTRAMIRDLLLYGGAGGTHPNLPRDYRLLHRTRAGRAALWAVRFGLDCMTGGNLGLTVLLMRRRELIG